MFTAGAPELAAQPAAALAPTQPTVTPIDEQAVKVSKPQLPELSMTWHRQRGVLLYHEYTLLQARRKEQAVQCLSCMNHLLASGLTGLWQLLPQYLQTAMLRCPTQLSSHIYCDGKRSACLLLHLFV